MAKPFFDHRTLVQYAERAGARATYTPVIVSILRHATDAHDVQRSLSQLRANQPQFFW
jgi:hypothetical protein